MQRRSTQFVAQEKLGKLVMNGLVSTVLQRRRVAGIAFAAVFWVIVALMLRPSSPVGHWDSAAGQDRYLATYAAAFAAMPAPDETLDVRTDYGIVRLYRFAGTGSAAHPLVLLPGR